MNTAHTEQLELHGGGLVLYYNADLLNVVWDDPACSFGVPPAKVLRSELRPFDGGIVLVLFVRLGKDTVGSSSLVTLELSFPESTGTRLSWLRYFLGHEAERPAGEGPHEPPGIDLDMVVAQDWHPHRTAALSSSGPEATARPMPAPAPVPKPELKELRLERCSPADRDDPEWVRLVPPTETLAMLAPGD